MKVLLAIVLLGSLQIQGASSVVDKFYDPAGTGPGPSVSEGPDQLRTIPIVRPFPPYGNVGLHYWFQNEGGARWTEEQAAGVRGALALHIRANTDGFLSVWLITGGSGTEVTTARGYNLKAASEYIVPAHVEFGTDAPRAMLIVLFARSQTEMAVDLAHAVQRLLTFSTRTAPDGLPQLVRASDSGTSGQVGTYVVNRRGSPIGVGISLKSR